MRPWTDPSLPTAQRVEALLSGMTLDEKVAQLGSVWPKGPKQTTNGTRIDYRMAPGLEADLAALATTEERMALGLGMMQRGYGGWPQSVADGCANTREWQRRSCAASPHGIPALVAEEGQTGVLAFGATVYPSSLAWAATFDPDLVEATAAAIGDDLARAGVDQVLAPVVDVVTDYRWGRCEECFGEDPYLVATMGTAYVRGVQAAGVIATLKHLAGHAASKSGRNHASVSIGRAELEDVHLVPFETAIREGGAKSVMNSYAAVDGVVPAASHWLLTDVLRRRWGVDGTVAAYYISVVNLLFDNRVVADVEEAGLVAIAAGLDLELPDTTAFSFLAAAVRAGRLDEALVDRAVRRVLSHKVDRGLLDDGFDPGRLGDPAIDLDGPRNRELARRLAERSVVLLSNRSAAGGGATLPLAPGTRVAVVGPTADEGRCLLGDYAFPNHAQPGFANAPDPLGLTVTTIRAALARCFPVTHAVGTGLSGLRGSTIVGEPEAGIAEALAVTAASEVAVVCVGDIAGMFGLGTSGEGCDVETLQLPGRQHDLVEAVLATGTPVVLVVVSGRPYALGAYAERCAAMVQAFFPGCEGGPALARIVSGDVTPSGHLPVQVPRSPHQTSTYLGGPLEHRQWVSTVDPTPLYGFGHGLSYTTFAVSHLVVSHDEVAADATDPLAASLVVRNTGDRDGATVVQLYLTDVAAQVQQPMRRLVGYARVPLAAGAAARVTFELHTDRFSFTGVSGTRIVEAGEFVLSAGLAETDLPLVASVRLTGDDRDVPEGRTLTTPVTIERT